MTASSVAATVRHRLGPLVAGRTVVLAMADPVESLLRQLRELGAGRLLVLGPATCRPLAAAVDAELVVVDLADENPQLTRQRWETMLADPPPGLQRFIEVRDPDRTALILVSPWFDTAELLGRPVFGAHRPGWAAYEGTLPADQLWDAAGIPHAPCLVVPCELDALLSAVDTLDDGAGTVWADATEGEPGSSAASHRIRDRAEARAAFTVLAGHYEQVRVMPFLTGQPCGLPGMVLPDGVVALRPVEHLVLHTDVGGRLLSAGSSTWDPSDAAQEQLRDVVLRVGAALRALVGKRSGFCVDGVLTPRGFRPIGCRTRWDTTLSCLAAELPDFPLLLAHQAVADGHDLGVCSAELETFLVSATQSPRPVFARGGPRATALGGHHLTGADSARRGVTYAET